MKRFYIALLAVCVLFASALALHSQETVSKVDSLIIYKFASLTDSVRYEKQISSKTDSVLNYILTHTFRWNEGTASWDNYQRFEYVQDSWNNVLSMERYEWDGTGGEWFHSYTDHKTVDSRGNILSLEAYFKSEADDPWYGSSYISYEYDTAGNRTRETYSDWDDQDQDWILAVRHLSEFDTKGREILKTNERWNATIEQWEEYGRRSFEYTEHPDGSIASQITQAWNEGGAIWERWSLITYDYNESGLLIREIRHDPLASGNDDEWHQIHKTEFNYDALGNRILHIYYQNTASYPEVVWEGTGTKVEDKYTPDGQLQFRTHYRWDDAGGDWKFRLGTETLFNVYGFRTTSIKYEDEGAGADSVLTEKMFFYPTAFYFTTYDSICSGGSYLWEGQEIDAEGSYEEAYVSVMGADSVLTLHLKENPNPASFTFTGATEMVQDQEELYIAPVDETLGYSWAVVNGTIVSGEFNDTLKVRWETMGEGEVASWALNIHGCSSDTTSVDVQIGSNGIENLTPAGIILFPIPVKEVLLLQSELDIQEIVVVDLNGRIVLSSSWTETGLDLSSLESGIYLVRLRDPDGQLLGVQKIIKE